MRRMLIGLMVLSALFCGCAKPAPHFTDRAFYYWKTVFKLTPQERGQLDSLKIGRLYLRMYDVSYDEVKKQPVPVSPVIFDNPPTAGLDIVPVVFIRQDVMKRISAAEARILASNMARLAGIILKKNRVEIKEFQLDYDWTPSTRERYFAFLGIFEKELAALYPGAQLTVTIRLHQVKYKKDTGVPPVKRGMLMAYNMKEIRYLTKENTVFDLKELGRYARSIKNYPITLDLALPVFPACYVYNNNELRSILTGLDAKVLKDPAKFKKNPSGYYAAVSYFRHNGTEFGIGDTLKFEGVNIADLVKAVSMIKKYHNAGGTLCLYHFDPALIEEATGEKILSLAPVFDN